MKRKIISITIILSMVFFSRSVYATESRISEEELQESSNMESTEVNRQTAVMLLSASSSSTIENTWNIGTPNASEVTATLYSDGTMIISGNGDMVSWNSSTSVPWCNERENIKKVEMQNGVTSIGDFAFDGCSSLTSIEIPSSVTSIGSSTFYGCSGLTSITIPSSITSIGSFAFNSCRSLSSINIPKGVKYISGYQFMGCSSLKSINVDSSNINYESVDGILFNKGKTKIIKYPGGRAENQYTIPSSVTSINAAAFYVCTRLTSINIPKGVTNIEDFAFYNCSNLTSIEIPDSVTSIGNYAFKSCNSLTSIEIQEGVTSIGDFAFDGCSSLTSIEIPAGVTSIGSNAFYYCISLTSIEIPDSVISIGNSAFEGCNSLTSIEIPSSVTSIGRDTFHYCKSLTSIEIPASVTSIGNSAFDFCRSLESINVDSSNTNYESVDGILFNKGKTEIIKYPEAKIEAQYTIPSSVTSIGNFAFEDCESLTSIEIPSSVTSIGNSAFKSCNSLTSIEIPSSINNIGAEVFTYCFKLKEINVYCNSYAEEYVIKYYSDKLNLIHNACESVVTAPTCTEGGYTTNICARCGDSYVDSYTEATGHNYIVKSTTEAVCEQGGIIVYECTNCKDTYQETIAALGHTEVVDASVEATCTETGLTEGKHCSVCGKVLVKQDVIEALRHNYESEVTAPTCTESGYTTHTCSRCGDSYVDSYTEATGHNYIVKSTTEAVCEQGGIIVYECTNCKDTYQETIAALGHTEVVDASVEATCIQAGLTEGKHCSVCGEILVAQEEVEALGHNYETEVTAPTCTERGYTTHTCTRCGESYVDSYTETLGHSFGAWIIDKEPTYEEEGHKYRICTNCNKEKQEEVIPRIAKEELQVTTTYRIKEKDNVKYIILAPSTTVSEMLKNITSNKEIKIVDKSGEEIEENALVVTGAKVVTKEDNKEIYTVVVKGDINGDGKVTFDDIIKTNGVRILENEDSISKAQLMASDINDTGKIEFRDIISINAIRISSLK